MHCIGKRVSTDTMQKFAERHLKPRTLERHGLPDIPYPVPATDMQSLCARNRVRPSWCCSGFVLRPPNAIWKSLLGASQMVTNLGAHGALADDTGPERASRRICSGPKRQPWGSLPDGVEGSSGGRKKHACTSLGWIVEPMIMKNDYPVTIIG